MSMLRNLFLGVVALSGLALATPVQARDDDQSHHFVFHGTRYTSPQRHYLYRGPGFVYSAPYYNYDPYWYPPVPTYGYTPGFTIAFGGFPWFHAQHAH